MGLEQEARQQLTVRQGDRAISIGSCVDRGIHGCFPVLCSVSMMHMRRCHVANDPQSQSISQKQEIQGRGIVILTRC